jgi:hypothetical protein
VASARDEWARSATFRWSQFEALVRSEVLHASDGFEQRPLLESAPQQLVVFDDRGDAHVPDALVLDVPVERGLELGAVVGLDHFHLERQAL